MLDIGRATEEASCIYLPGLGKYVSRIRSLSSQVALLRDPSCSRTDTSRWRSTYNQMHFWLLVRLLVCYTYYQRVMITWDTKGDVCKNIFASVVALKHCIFLKHLEIGQTCSLCFHLHVFKTLLAASLSSMTGGIWSFLVIFSSTSCWASSNS